MEIYSSAKRRQIITSKNSYKCTEINSNNKSSVENGDNEMLEIVKDKMKNRFYNMMQFFFEIEEVKWDA